MSYMKDKAGRRLDSLVVQASNSQGRRLFGALAAPMIAGPAPHLTALSALTAVTFQQAWQLYTPAPQIRLVYTNFSLPGSNNLTPEGTGSTTFTVKVGLIWGYNNGTGGTLIPVTFDRARTITVGSIGIGEVWTSDPIDVPPTVTAGTWFVVRSYVTQTGTALPLTRSPWIPAASPSTWAEGYVSTDLTDTAGNTFSASNAAGDPSGYGPTAIVGWGADGLNRTTLFTGDSIGGGTGWASESGSLSLLTYPLWQAKVGAVNLCHSGEQLTTVLAAYANQRMRLTMAYGCANAISQHGINDLYAGSRTAAQLKADYLTWWGYLKAKGCTVFQTTLTPSTNSTDAWQTLAGQTSTNTTANGHRQTINQWLRAPASAGPGNSALYDASGNLAGVFDIAQYIEVNADGTALTISPTTGAITNGAGGYRYVENTVYDTGTVTSIPSSQKLVDTSKTWTASQWVDYAMVITADATTPASVGQVRIIAATTASQLNTDTAWTTNPSVGATYKIVKIFTSDGIHPTKFGHVRAAAAVDTTKLAAQ